MKILPNIGPLLSIYKSIRNLDQFKAVIDEARRNGDDELERAYILKSTSTWGRDIVERFDVNLVVRGKENIPTEGPVVYAANHQGYADIPACAAALDKIQFGFIAKEDLTTIPVFGKWLLRIRSVPIKRDDARSSLRTIEEAISLIKRGYSMLVFPEGTRSKGGPMKEFKKGSLRLATKPGVPVVPITIDGSYKMFEETGRVEKGQTIFVTVHPAIPTADMQRKEQGELAERVEGTVRSALAEQK